MLKKAPVSRVIEPYKQHCGKIASKNRISVVTETIDRDWS